MSKRKIVNKTIAAILGRSCSNCNNLDLLADNCTKRIFSFVKPDFWCRKWTEDRKSEYRKIHKSNQKAKKEFDVIMEAWERLKAENCPEDKMMERLKEELHEIL